MTGHPAQSLREILEEIDATLLALLTGERPFPASALERVAMLETARGAVLRLLAAAEREETQPGDPGDRA